MTAFVVTPPWPRLAQRGPAPPTRWSGATTPSLVRTASINPLEKMARNGQFKQLKAGLAGPITAFYLQLEQATH